MVNTTGRVSAKRQLVIYTRCKIHPQQNKSCQTSYCSKLEPKTFSIVCWNLGPDGNDELLKEAFLKYPSMSQVHVPIDRKTSKNKGFGFVAFGKSEDYLHAFQEMNGKYIGQHPVQLKRAESSVPKKTKNKRK